MKTLILTAATIFVTAAALHAHVTLQPREAAPGATVTYTMRVPTEGTVTTTGIELEIPDGVAILSVDGAADTYEVKKAGDRIVAIAWKTEIPPKAFKTFTFSAKNPTEPAELSWKAHQRFADGTVFDWIEPAGGKRPAARTRITAATDKPAAPAEHQHQHP
jgi:uncharacterized protein YcnI